MNISYEWLLQYITTNASIEQISNTLTEIGLEVEGVKNLSDIPHLEGVVVAEVQQVRPHPNADRLKLCTVYDGKNEFQIVCGANNVRENTKVALATLGTQLTFADGKTLTIKKSKIRGEESYGMLCAEDELGLSHNHEGIMILDEYAGLGIPLQEYLETQQDYVFEIGLTPNRSDAMSHYGVARDLHAGMKLRNIPSQLQPLSSDTLLNTTQEPTYKVIIENEDCKRYCLAHITNVSVSDSPTWLQNKLKAIGLEPINNIVDITNYILHSYGQPLHAFDAKAIHQNTIRVGNCPEGTVFTTLDHTQRKLSSEDLIIKNGDDQPLCIAGVYGGLESGVTAQTTDIVLESAYFDPVAVRKTAKRNSLNTDASFRFERGVDPNLTLFALEKASEMIVELAQGQLSEKILDIHHGQDHTSLIKVRTHRVNTIIGNTIPIEKIKEIFSVLEIEILQENEESFEVKIPAYRTDVTREIDVIEEILRIYGYNTITTQEKISYSLNTDSNYHTKEENTISELLASNGYFEVINNSLTRSTGQVNEVEIINPLSQDLAVMRSSMLPGMLENIAFNLNRNNTDLKLFEWGKTYQKIENDYRETPLLAMALCGHFYSESWTTPSSPTTFFQLKGMMYALFQKLGIAIEEDIVDDPNYVEALAFNIDNETLGQIGKINPTELKKYGIKSVVWFAQINWQKVLQHISAETFRVQAIPKYPGSRRDLALLLNPSVLYKDLKQSALQVNHTLLKNVNLFDVYEGKNLPEGKKSYALSYEFLDDEKTIKDEQIDAIIQKIIQTYQKEYNAELRT